MSRKLPDSHHAAKRKKSFERLVEKYYGKLALLNTLLEQENPDLNYIRDLKVRLRSYRNDLTYRGHDEIESP